MSRQIRIINFIVALSCCPLFTINAEEIEDNYEIRSEIEAVFSNLDTTRVPTGLLRDYATELVNLDQYDGLALADSNYVGLSDFEGILRTVRSSNIYGTNPIPVVSEYIWLTCKVPCETIQRFCLA